LRVGEPALGLHLGVGGRLEVEVLLDREELLPDLVR
jgi:hypothetical protein